jgi:hypothetical protein
VQPPLAHVAVPAGLHLADEHYLQTIHVDTNPQEVTGVVAGIEDRLGRRGTESKARRNVDPVGADHALLVLPVEVRPARVALVVDVENQLREGRFASFFSSR